MPVKFNHAIVPARDRHKSSAYFAQLFGLAEPVSWGPFTTVTLEEGVHLQFAQFDGEIQMQHFAFLVDDDTFDQIYNRILESKMEHWADPQGSLAGRINTNHGGRGVYFKDPAGHGLEIITRPYSSV